MSPNDFNPGTAVIAPTKCPVSCPSAMLPARRWRPSPLLFLTLLIHILALIWLALAPAQWLWALAILGGIHAILTVIVFFPRSTLLGQNINRLPDTSAGRREISLTFDDGPDPLITPQVLDLLDRYRAKASFFCLGERVSQYPDLAREIVARGHSIENHSHGHPYTFAFFGARRMTREIKTAQAIICDVTGSYPEFFRAPMGLRNPLFLDFVLARLGLRLVSWTRRGYDTLSNDPKAILARLERNLAAGDILVMHDVQGVHKQTMILDVLPKLLEAIARENLRSVSLPQAMQ